MAEYRCEFPGCNKELAYGGRGRPPKRCEEHKGMKIESEGTQEVITPRTRPRPGKSETETKSETPAPRARPGSKPKEQEAPKADRTNKEQTESLGKQDTQSRAKAETNVRRASMQVLENADVPRGVNGTPMAKITFSASELIPTGQYANVSVGPAQVQVYVDIDREVVESETFFNDDQKENLVKALNELADMVGGDIISVQRNLVLQSMQDQLETK